MRQQIRQFILNSFLFTDDQAQLVDDDSLLERGIMDSTGVLELVAFIESECRVKIGDDELVPENLDSVNRIVAFVERKLSPSATSAVGAV